MSEHFPAPKMVFNQETSILLIEWPDFSESFYQESQFVFKTIINKIKSTNAKYLLSDTRKGNFDMSDTKYRALSFSLANALAQTQIQRVARIVTTATAREKLMQELVQKSKLDIPVRDFYSEEEALEWLMN